MGIPPRGAGVACDGRRRRTWGRPWFPLLAGALLLGLVAMPATAATDSPQADEADEADPRDELREAADEARAELRAASQRLSSARADTRAARTAGRTADGAVRRAEEQIVPAVLAHSEAQEELALARGRVRSLRRELRTSRAELELARERLADRAVRAYKHGSVAADTALPLLAAREASSPGELAQALKDLEVLALTGAAEVDDLVTRITRFEAELVAAVDERGSAEVALEEADEDIVGSEANAAARRRDAAAAEARLLAAIERELAADRARDEARRHVDQALAELGPRPAPADAEDDAEDDADDEEDSPADLLRGRQRAHARQVSLSEERRRTADDWSCPVEGSRFVNDWAFPRTGDRRHEGTDVFADTGTPVLAVVDGVVTGMDTVDRYDGRRGLGGITLTFEQGDQRFYNAHLDAIHPAMEVGRELEAGEVIGWVGRTGNARGTPPHLHVGWYVDDVAVNPYGSLAVACHG